MSFQRDYLLRMIEMLGDFIIAILGKIKKGDIEQANYQLEQIYYDFLKNDAAFFRLLPIDGMTDKLLNEHNYTNDHLKILAELYLLEAELNLANGKNMESKSYYKKALKLFEFIDNELKTYDEERMNKIKIICEKIKE